MDEIRAWPVGGGETGGLIRSRDWSGTPLGPVEGWPQSLKTAVDLVLGSPEPASVIWGAGRIQLYNDAYADQARERHPALFGVPFPAGAPLDTVFAGGPAVVVEDEHAFTSVFSPIHDESGVVGGVLHRVAASPRAEAVLRESEERHRLIIEAARDYAILTTDPEGRIESWSPGAEAVYGWSAVEALGRPVNMTFTPEDRAEGVPEEELATARREGSAPDVRWHLRSDGARVFIEGTSRALHDAAGEVRGFLKIGQDVTRRRQVEEELRESEARLRSEAARSEVLRQLVTAVEDERRRLARELHDQMGQQVTGLRLALRALEGAEDPEERASRIVALERLADAIARDIQGLALKLRPPALDNLGLPLALQSHLEEWSERHGVACDFHSVGLEGARLPGEVETTLYRVVQEGLTNVLKHAGATRVGLVLERRRGMVSMILEDDGAGFDVDRALASQEKAKRLGLRGMRERVALVGGEMEIESSPGIGTTLFVRVPDPAAPTAGEGGTP
ncbi:MAG: PAS domain S-box protein [Gemmatimonadetes bacterium]|nr:PAS domain S-box protein [Gemmatimonadota bacterium]